MHWMPRQGVCEVVARLYMPFDVQNEFLHVGVLVTIADDFEGLHEGDTGRHHGCKLAAEDCDIFRCYPLAAGAE